MKVKVRLTKKRKLAILKDMLKLIKGDTLDGLCNVLFDCAGYEIWVDHNIEDFIKKPKDAGGYYWYPLTEAGRAKRIKLINNAIKKLQCK